MSPGLRTASGKWAIPSFEPISGRISLFGSRSRPYRALQNAAIDCRSSGAPWSRAYWWNAGFSTWCWRLLMIAGGRRPVGVADAQVDHVAARGDGGLLLLVDLGEQVRRELLEPLGLHERRRRHRSGRARARWSSRRGPSVDVRPRHRADRRCGRSAQDAIASSGMLSLA